MRVVTEVPPRIVYAAELQADGRAGDAAVDAERLAALLGARESGGEENSAGEHEKAIERYEAGAF